MAFEEDVDAFFDDFADEVQLEGAADVALAIVNQPDRDALGGAARTTGVELFGPTVVFGALEASDTVSILTGLAAGQYRVIAEPMKVRDGAFVTVALQPVSV